MVHTQIPYSSFENAANYTNSEGGLWDVFSFNDPPGSIYSQQTIPELAIKFIALSGTMYGDVGVGSIGGPNSTLNYCWDLFACANANVAGSLNITTTIADDAYWISVLTCPSVWTLESRQQGSACGTFVVNSESSIRLTVSTQYIADGLENASAYVGAFKLALWLNASAPIQTTASIQTTTPIQTTTSIQTTVPPIQEVKDANHTLAIILACGIIPSLFILGILSLLCWRRPCWQSAQAVWRRWKSRVTFETGPKGDSKERITPLFVSEGGAGSNDGVEEGLGGYRVMDGHGLDVVEKVRRGIPVAYPFPESLEIERGEKSTLASRSDPIVVAISHNVTTESLSVDISTFEGDTNSSPSNPFDPGEERSSRDATSHHSSVQLNRHPSPGQQAIFDLTVLEEQVMTLSRMYTAEATSDLPQLSIPTTSSELAQRVDSVSQRLQELIVSRLAPEGLEILDAYPPAYDQGNWSED